MQLAEFIVDQQTAVETKPSGVARLDRKQLRQLGSETTAHLFDTIAVPFFCNVVVKEESVAHDLEIGLSSHAAVTKNNIIVVNYLTSKNGRNQTYFHQQESNMRDWARQDERTNHELRSQIVLTYYPLFNYVFKKDDGSREHIVQHLTAWSGEKEAMRETAHTFATETSGQSYTDVMANQLWSLADGIARQNEMEPLDREQVYALFPYAYENAAVMMDDPIWAISAAGLAYFLEENGHYYLDPVIRAAAVAK